MPKVVRERRLTSPDLIDFASNDTLGLSKHPSVIDALILGANQFGVGGTASPVVCGHSNAHKGLESRFCDTLGLEAAITFSSGFAANLAVISGLICDGAFAFVDRDIHASMCDGLRLCAGKWKRYRNLSFKIPELVEGIIAKYLITESIFSTSGRSADWDNINKICHDSRLRDTNTFCHSRVGGDDNTQIAPIIDDAHGFGISGEGGLGAAAFLTPENKKNAVLIYPMGKALGCQGAVVCGPAKLINQIMQNARSLIYSTALSPALATAASAAFDVIIEGNTLREKLFSNIAFFKEQAQSLGFDLLPSDSPIQSIVIGDADLTENIRQHLLDKGFNVGSMRPPTVPEGQSLLRIVIHSFNSINEITELLKFVKVALQECLYVPA